ncbi:TPA: hypothetical protein I7768_14380 [Vibrio vulnificus]|nr:hypothetical protein D8T47_19030 [Vibrio vulnificus]RZQ10422.1 hypothetical protein D8T46_19240 [Vibrio vulnificus]HAS8478176.1 hypothetical protein [Vibrio vulnificus]HAS8501236.1 hypothetical protein [Vibrio vulnificus]
MKAHGAARGGLEQERFWVAFRYASCMRQQVAISKWLLYGVLVVGSIDTGTIIRSGLEKG